MAAWAAHRASSVPNALTSTRDMGRGLADLHERDPLGRRLDIEKKERYAQELREQMADDRRRKEAAVASFRDDATPPRRGLRGHNAVVPRVSSCTAENLRSLPATPALPVPIEQAAAATGSEVGSDASPSKMNSNVAPDSAADKVAQLQELMRARLRSIEEEQRLQSEHVQQLLEERLSTARKTHAEEVQERLRETQSELSGLWAAVSEQKDGLAHLRNAVKEQSVDTIGLRKELKDSSGRSMEDWEDKVREYVQCMMDARAELVRLHADSQRQEQELQHLRNTAGEQALDCRRLGEELKAVAARDAEGTHLVVENLRFRLEEQRKCDLDKLQAQIESAKCFEPPLPQEVAIGTIGLAANFSLNDSCNLSDIADLRLSLQHQASEFHRFREEMHAFIAKVDGDLDSHKQVDLGELREVLGLQEALESLRNDANRVSRSLEDLQGTVSSHRTKLEEHALDVHQIHEAFQQQKSFEFRPGQAEDTLRDAPNLDHVLGLIQKLREDMLRHVGKLALRVEMPR